VQRASSLVNCWKRCPSVAFVPSRSVEYPSSWWPIRRERGGPRPLPPRLFADQANRSCRPPPPRASEGERGERPRLGVLPHCRSLRALRRLGRRPLALPDRELRRLRDDFPRPPAGCRGRAPRRRLRIERAGTRRAPLPCYRLRGPSGAVPEFRVGAGVVQKGGGNLSEGAFVVEGRSHRFRGCVQAWGKRQVRPPWPGGGAENGSLKHTVPAAPLVEVDVFASWPVWTGAPRAVDPPTTSTLPARLELGLALGSSRFHLSSTTCSSHATRPESATLRAELHRRLRRSFESARKLSSAAAKQHCAQIAELPISTGTSGVGKEP